MRSKLQTVLVLVVTTILIVGGVILVRAPWKTPSGVSSIEVSVDPNQPAPRVGSKAPEFAAITIDDEVIYNKELLGKPVWLVFGATWCPNCRAEAADVEEVAKTYEGRVAVLSVYSGEDPDLVTGYAQRLGLTHIQVPDPLKEMTAAYQVMGLPTHIMIDSQGTVTQIIQGPLSKSKASELLDALLG